MTTSLTLLAGMDHDDSKTRPAAIAYAESLPADQRNTLDLAKSYIPPVSPDFLPGQNDVSVQLLNMLEAADTLIIAAPVYNFGIPASLKLWIDQIVVAGRTFDPNTYQGLLNPATKVTVFAASGGSDPLTLPGYGPYLLQILGLIGFTDITITVLREAETHPEEIQPTDENLC